MINVAALVMKHFKYVSAFNDFWTFGDHRILLYQLRPNAEGRSLGRRQTGFLSAM